jgi:4-hydroxy-tetrahydrodipicolinate synthase
MFTDLKDKLHGCFYTIFTPFSEDESIDYESLEKYLATLYSQGARRFYAMAYNSRYSQLKSSEILQLNEFCIRFLKKLDPKNIVIVGDPIHCSTRETIEFTQHAKDAGADLISLIVSEKYFTDDQILSHFAQVGSATNMAILVHEMPFLSGKGGAQMHWPNSLIKSLPKIPQIVALKEDAKDFEVTKAALELEPSIRIIIACLKRDFINYRKLGARAYLNGISIINARIGEAFWNACEVGDHKTVQFITEKLEAPFFDVCVAEYGWHRTNKALLQSAGLMHRRDRMPLLHLSDDDYVLVNEVYAKLRQSWAAYFGEDL